MAKLQNTFSWSFSAARDFAVCPRRRYWSKYAKWGGWERDATEEQRTAYHLDKMDSRYSLQGQAVENAVMWVLREAQKGRMVDADQAYQTIARPYLNQCWRESQEGLWRRNAKKHCCLHEHYYARLHTGEETDWTHRVIATTQCCIRNFIETVLPRLADVRPEDEIPIATPAQGGDPESFRLEDVKVYAIPDYVYRAGDRIVIHDWKSGKPKPEHRTQVALYGLWAQARFDVPPESIEVVLEYLAHAEHVSHRLSADTLAQVIQTVEESVADMTQYLVGEDRRANRPVPRLEWDLAADRGPCRWCNFYALCEPEFGEDAPPEAG